MARSEARVLLAISVFLLAWVCFVAPVGDLPRSTNSWDVLHSGKHFADQGFLASKLQPRWSPPNGRAPYLVYTHYPPLPYWVAGVVHSVVRDPIGRVGAMLRLVLAVGLGAVLSGYLFLRTLGIAPLAASLACAALLWSAQWWGFATRELSWASWLQLFQLAGVAALAWALGRFERRWRRGLLLALACALAAALSAFDAWPWFPTLLGVLALLALAWRRDLLRPLALATGIAGLASLSGAATRIAINGWHFGSFSAVLQDAREAYGARSTYAHEELEIPENRVNYMELPKQAAASHAAWIGEFFRTAPPRLADLFLPEARAGRWALGLAALLGLAGWLVRRRRPPEGDREPWPGRLGWLVALVLAPLPFVLICPAIAVQQWGPLLGFAPAALLAAALIGEGVLALPGPWARGALGTPIARRTLIGVIAGAVAASPLLRAAGASAPSWPAPPAQCQAALRALSHLEGVVFVDLDDANLLMFLLPLDSPLALKPVWTQARYLSGVRPLRILEIGEHGKLRESELARFTKVEVPGLPEDFELWVLGDHP